MSPPDTTSWRNDEIVPKGYDDIRILVRDVRDARDEIVEFDWGFCQEDLRRVRQAVHNWGLPVQGRFKRFDARVLAAINAALGEADSVFVLNEPANAAGPDSAVSCVVHDGLFRLCGHASFDVVLGYGLAAVSDDPETAARLGEEARGTIATAVGMLGWDLSRLSEERLRPARNALVGLPPSYGIAQEPAPTGPVTEMALDFRGPFAAVDLEGQRCLFTNPIAAQTGVYLWTIEVGAQHRAWYIGQTRRGYGQRMTEHIGMFLSGQYDTLDAASLAAGVQRVVWRAGPGGLRLGEFLRRGEELAPQTLKMINLLRFHVAPFAGPRELYDRIEGGLGRHFKSHQDPALHGFFSPGIKLPAKVPYDKPIRLALSAETPVSGLPRELHV